MVRSVGYRPLAQDDLKEIYDWLARQAGPDVALELVEAIEERCDRLGISSTGRQRPEIGRGVLSIPFRRRGVIAYRIVQGEVEIIGALALHAEVEIHPRQHGGEIPVELGGDELRQAGESESVASSGDGFRRTGVGEGGGEQERVGEQDTRCIFGLPVGLVKELLDFLQVVERLAALAAVEFEAQPERERAQPVLHAQPY